MERSISPKAVHETNHYLIYPRKRNQVWRLLDQQIRLFLSKGLQERSQREYLQLRIRLKIRKMEKVMFGWRTRNLYRQLKKKKAQFLCLGKMRRL